MNCIYKHAGVRLITNQQHSIVRSLNLVNDITTSSAFPFSQHPNSTIHAQIPPAFPVLTTDHGGALPPPARFLLKSQPPRLANDPPARLDPREPRPRPRLSCCARSSSRSTPLAQEHGVLLAEHPRPQCIVERDAVARSPRGREEGIYEE